MRRRVGRWLPFLFLSALSIYVAFQAPHGRKPFSLSLDITPSTLAQVAIKPLHFRASAALCWLALLAVGASRVPLAVGLTLLVCFGIELAQATVVGHNARLADMLSYLIAASGAAILFVGAAALTKRVRERRTSAQSQPSQTVPN